MRKTIFTIIFLTIFLVGTGQTNYFVSLNGNDNNSGLNTASSWRTITYAMSANSPVAAGDTVFIKAGDYGNENIIINKDGTLSNPIVIEGYQTLPGDNPNLNFIYGDSLDASVMPLINGGDRTSGLGIDINGSSYISIKNIQITNYEYGIYTWSSSSTNLILDNLIIMSIGNINASYSGLGIGIIYADSNIVRNCIVVNSAAEGITIVANNNLIENCQVFCDEDTTYDSSTDYYISTEGNHNTFSNCYIERVGNLEHVGHGMGLKGNCEFNLFENCEAKNFEGGGFYVRHRGAKFNEFRNCTAILATGFLVRDGASNNEFNACKTIDCYSATRFLDTGEDGGAQYAGRHNSFNNCIFINSTYAIDFHYYDQISPADSNLFANCVFHEGNYLFKTERENSENSMINCIVSGIQNLDTGNYVLNFEYSFSDFYNNGFSTPAGTNNISANPLFENVAASDFHLQNASPCIDAGTSVNAPNVDFEGTTRPQGIAFDIGAFEFINLTTIIADKENISVKVFPNPANNFLQLKTKDIDIDKIEIFNTSGQKIKSIKYFEGIKIDISMYNSGTYFLKFIDNRNKKEYSAKFLIE